MQLTHDQPAMPTALTDQHRQRYSSWYDKYRYIIGDFAIERLMAALDAVFDEALRSGIDTPTRFFVYATSRLIMPEMRADQYIITMDIVFDDSNVEQKLKNIIRTSKISPQ